MTPVVLRAVSLYSDANGSDKLYNVQLVSQDGGHVVNYQNGARGGRLASGTKTPVPVDLALAEKKFEALVREKMHGSSRYRVLEGMDATASYAAPVSSKVATGAPTMMLSTIRDAAHRESLLDDPAYVAEQKFDGVFFKAIVDAGHVTGSNKKAFTTSVYAMHEAALLAAGRSFTIDAEQVGEHLYVFECPSVDGAGPARTYEERKRALAALGIEGPNIHIVESSAPTRASKLAKIAEVAAHGGEGVVFKRRDGAYVDGVSPQMFKDPFRASATLIVVEHNKLARSVVTGAHDTAGALVKTGSVNIPASVALPAPGSLIEVQYLYANPGSNALQQPVFKGARTDQDIADCTLAQLKYKVELDHEAQSAPARRSPRP